MARRTAVCGCVWERRDVAQGWRCGRRAWYDRDLDQHEGEREDEFCARCLEIGTRENGRLSELVAA